LDTHCERCKVGEIFCDVEWKEQVWEVLGDGDKLNVLRRGEWNGRGMEEWRNERETLLVGQKELKT
jgi:hypothetical protein